MSEKIAVQNPIIKYAEACKWSFVNQKEAEERRGFQNIGQNRQDSARYASLFFDNLLYEKVKEFNDWFTDIKEALVRNLSNLQTTIEGNKEFLAYLKGEKPVYSEKENRELNLKLIDFENIENNIFEVTEEYYFHNGRYGNRKDIVFLINGIPVLIVECKNPNKMDAFEVGMTQLKRYQNETPEMMIPEQMFAITESIFFHYGVTWNISKRSIFKWKDRELGQLESKIKSFFDRERILRYIKDYIVFQEKDEELKKYILSQHQVQAVELVVDRACDAAKYRGLVWHTQGSGKTFTIIKSAEILFKAQREDKPTIILLIDRNELEDQLIRNLKSVGIEHSEHASSIDKLNNLLEEDYRGIIVSMIHKFQGMKANINKRRNIYVLVDEAHRTTQGDLGNYLMAAIPNATYVGFTGTPIDQTEHGKGTFKTFGTNDDKGYLHKYSIVESIEDKTTLPLFYALAENELLVPRQMLEKEFLKLAEAEGISDIEELNKILDRAINTKNFLKGEDRVNKIAKFVAQHYKSYVEPLGFKAFLVGVDREACVMYKQALDRYLPSEFSEIVFTGNHNDNEELKKYHLREEEEKQIRKDFAKIDKLPKILIVTEKLLTGFDAPVLYAMYLDKPMRDHTLLQAIARVNRPYENEEKQMFKKQGFVLDFIGIFEKNLKDALAFDPETVNSVIKNVDVLKELFREKMQKEASLVLKLVSKTLDDKDLDILIDEYKDKEKRQEFFKLYKEIEALYEIISPDIFLRPFIADYNSLTEIYARVRNAFSKRIEVDKEFQRKTDELVRRQINISNIKSGVEAFEINKETLEKLKAKQTQDNVKVINLIKSIEKYAEENSGDLVLISLSDRAKKIQEKYEDNQISTQLALAELFNIAEGEVKRREEDKGGDSLKSFLQDILKDKNIKDYQDVSNELKLVLQSYPNWYKSEQESRSLRQEMYFTLLAKEDDIDKCNEVVEYLLNLLDKAKKL